MPVCVCSQNMAKKKTTNTGYGNGKTSNYTRIKSNNRLLVKPFRFKVITIFIPHGYCFQTREDSWEHLDTLKHKYSCIMTIASKALHKSKQNLGSGWYNIEHWLQEFSITFRLRLFQIFKSCAVHVTRTSAVLTFEDLS